MPSTVLTFFVLQKLGIPLFLLFIYFFIIFIIYYVTEIIPIFSF